VRARRIAFALSLALGALPAAAAEAPPGTVTSGRWSPSVYLDAYFLKGGEGYLVPTVFMDRGSVHLEGRYNYEDFDTASLFAGWGFPFGEEGRSLRLTPMLGGVFGNTNGVAPGLEVEARWGRLSYWLEAEYVFDLEDSSASYLYTWSELYAFALPWLWAGVSVQRLRPVQSPREVDFGPMVGVGKPGAPGGSLSFYAYGLTGSSPSFLVTAAAQF
jgi:hypothetical protein